MAWYEEFLLGPLGYMSSIPSPSHSSGVESNILRMGGEFESASGNLSTDVLGFKKEWKFTWPWLSSIQANQLIAFFRASQRRQLRIIDPYAENLLSAEVSSGGGDSRTADAFSPNTGTVSCLSVTPALPSILVPQLDTMIQWVVPTSTAGILLGDSSVTDRIPLRDQRTLSLTIQATGQGTVQALIRPYNLAGSALSDVLGASVVLDSTWKTVSIVYSPASTHVSVIAGLSIASAVGIRTLAISALKLGEKLDPWCMGEGVGLVIVRQFTRKLRPHNRYEIQVTIREK